MGPTLWFLLETVGQLLATACLLRAYMHWLHMGSRDPIGHFVIAVTDWAVKPLRRVMPTMRQIDWASILAALAISILLAMIYVFIAGLNQAPMFGAVVLTAVFWLIKWSLFLLIVVVIGQAILSWVNPHAPIAPTLEGLSRPFLAPIRRFVPLVGGIDLSPLVLILLLQVVQVFLQSTFAPYLLAY